MFKRTNLFEHLTIFSSVGTVFCIALNYLTNISPITGIWFPIYVLSVFISSVYLSFKTIQRLLHLNKPIRYNLGEFIQQYPFISFISSYIPPILKPRKRISVEETKEYDTNELSIISTVLERKLVSSWYMAHVSEEIGFPFACKQMIDQIISKAFQVCNKIDTRDMYTDICSVLIGHLREYKKAVKRLEKANLGKVESHYKMSHLTSDSARNRKCSSSDHCTNILRIILKDLVPWELWDTPHSELLVRILSKRLDHFIENTLTDANWLNDKLLTVLHKKDVQETSFPETGTETSCQSSENHANINTNHVSNKESTSLDPKNAESLIVDPTNQIENTNTPQMTKIESVLSNLLTKSTAPILQRAVTEKLQDNNADSDTKDVLQNKLSDPVAIQTSPLLRQRRGRQGKNEVKIYDRIIEGSVKTWDTDVDLQCISMGQDLLASLDGELMSCLWENDNAESGEGWSPNPPHRKSPQPTWFGEDELLDLELTNGSPKKQDLDARPVAQPEHSNFSLANIHNIKDLQSTMNQAKHKIGDLQVAQTICKDIDVPVCKEPPLTGDEAAGMMEGILDFGIAGFKKGLRLTGLQDNAQERSFLTPNDKERNVMEKPSPVNFSLQNPIVPGMNRENSFTAPLQKDTSEVNITAPVLIKQHHVNSQDNAAFSVPKSKHQGNHLAESSESPDLEYEEATDLSSSIAKLRSLLQQPAESPVKLPEDVWWEGAEETRGRTQEARHAARPVDSAALADEYDMCADRLPLSGAQTSNNMQRLDKLLQRTVTGVFNSIKTAVGAEGGDETTTSVDSYPIPAQDWTFVCTSVDLGVGGAVARLVGSRRVYTHVEAAQDPLEQLSAPSPPQDTVPDDLEEWCASCGSCWCGTAEVACGAGLWETHVAHRVATLLLADFAELLIREWLDDFTSWLKKQIFVIFKQMAKKEEMTAPKQPDVPPRAMDIDETCSVICDKMPRPLRLLGEEALSRAVKLNVTSLSHRDINKDIAYRMLDLFALHFKRSSSVKANFS